MKSIFLGALTFVAILVAILATSSLAPAASVAPMASAAPVSPKVTQLHTDVYPIEGAITPQTLVFKMDRTTTTDGSKESVRNVYADSEGKEVVTEAAELQSGKIVSFKQDQKQINAQGEVVVENGKAKFTYTKDGKTKKDEESVGDDFIVTASLHPYLKARWEDLKKGKTVKAKLGVLDRLEVIEFQFRKDKEVKLEDGKKGFTIKMTPRSFVIAALVNPIYFKVTEEDGRIIDVEGRTPMKYKSAGSWKDFDGRSVYRK